MKDPATATPFTLREVCCSSRCYPPLLRGRVRTPSALDVVDGPVLVDSIKSQRAPEYSDEPGSPCRNAQEIENAVERNEVLDHFIALERFTCGRVVQVVLPGVVDGSRDVDASSLRPDEIRLVERFWNLLLLTHFELLPVADGYVLM